MAVNLREPIEIGRSDRKILSPCKPRFGVSDQGDAGASPRFEDSEIVERESTLELGRRQVCCLAPAPAAQSGRDTLALPPVVDNEIPHPVLAEPRLDAHRALDLGLPSAKLAQYRRHQSLDVRTTLIAVPGHPFIEIRATHQDLSLDAVARERMDRVDEPVA
jgi:hypothetical protein